MHHIQYAPDILITWCRCNVGRSSFDHHILTQCRSEGLFIASKVTPFQKEATKRSWRMDLKGLIDQLIYITIDQHNTLEHVASMVYLRNPLLEWTDMVLDPAPRRTLELLVDRWLDSNSLIVRKIKEVALFVLSSLSCTMIGQSTSTPPPLPCIIQSSFVPLIHCCSLTMTSLFVQQWPMVWEDTTRMSVCIDDIKYPMRTKSHHSKDECKCERLHSTFEKWKEAYSNLLTLPLEIISDNSYNWNCIAELITGNLVIAIWIHYFILLKSSGYISLIRCTNAGVISLTRY